MASVQVRNLCSRMLLHSRRSDAFSCTVIWRVQTANYAIAKRPGGATKPAAASKGKIAGPMQKKQLEVETDAKVLCSRVCGLNYFKEGEDPVLKPDSEYPDWLWNMHLDPIPIPIEELSEDDPAYWKRLKRMNLRQNNEEQKHKKLRRMFVNRVRDERY